MLRCSTRSRGPRGPSVNEALMRTIARRALSSLSRFYASGMRDTPYFARKYFDAVGESSLRISQSTQVRRLFPKSRLRHPRPRASGRLATERIGRPEASVLRASAGQSRAVARIRDRFARRLCWEHAFVTRRAPRLLSLVESRDVAERAPRSRCSVTGHFIGNDARGTAVAVSWPRMKAGAEYLHWSCNKLDLFPY